MNERYLRSLKEGMKNTRCWRRNSWRSGYMEEAIELLENKEEMLEEYDCYDYLFA